MAGSVANYSSPYASWKNYATWATNTWLMNDEWTESDVVKIVMTSEDKYEIAERLTDLVRDLCDYEALTPLCQSLVEYFIEDVDFLELAEHYIEDYRQGEI